MCPTYDMECHDCGLEGEFLLTIAERDKYIPCAKCGNAMSRVVVHDIRFRLKGVGWGDVQYGSSVQDAKNALKGTGKSYKIDDDGNGYVE